MKFIPNIYNENDVKIWENKFEEFGSFYGVEKYIKGKKNGSGPNHQTIKNRIKKKFERENRDFKKWLDTYSKQIQLRDYSSKKKLEYMKNLFESYGSFQQVENHIKHENDGKSPNRRTITFRLKEMFKKEGKDFNEWINTHYRGTGPDSNYIFEELQNWEELFEKIGSFRGVEAFIKDNNNDEGPYYTTIIKHLQKKFIEEVRDFESWFQHFSKDFDVWSQQFNKNYNEQDDINWKILYEEIGSFSGVEKIIKARNNGVSPTRRTIKRRLKRLFEKGNEDFDDWVFQHFNPETERRSLIGRMVHIVLEDIFIRFTRNRNLKSFYEVKPSPFDSDFICDNSLIRDHHFDCNLEMNQNIISISSQIQEINIDYTLSTDFDVVSSKCFKYYQGKEKLLIIVLLSEHTHIKEKLRTLEIPYKENVKFLSSEEFAQFIGYDQDPEVIGQYLEVLTISKKAIYNDFYLEKVANMVTESKNNLERAISCIKEGSNLYYNPLRQDGFENCLKYEFEIDLSYLLYKDVGHMGLFKYF